MSDDAELRGLERESHRQRESIKSLEAENERLRRQVVRFHSDLEQWAREIHGYRVRCQQEVDVQAERARQADARTATLSEMLAALSRETSGYAGGRVPPSRPIPHPPPPPTAPPREGQDGIWDNPNPSHQPPSLNGASERRRLNQ